MPTPNRTKLKQLQAELATLKACIAGVEKEVSDEARETFKDWKPIYTSNLRWLGPQELTSLMHPGGLEASRFVISQELANGSTYDALVEHYGHPPMGTKPEAKRNSVRYVITKEHILTHDSGGYVILATPTILTPFEIAELKQGRIPSRLLNREPRA